MLRLLGRMVTRRGGERGGEVNDAQRIAPAIKLGPTSLVRWCSRGERDRKNVKLSTHVLTPKQPKYSLEPCFARGLCDEHTPEWALRLGTGESEFYRVGKVDTAEAAKGVAT